MNQIKTIDGHLNAADLKFAILATRFNDFIVDRLVGGAVDYLIRHGGSEENLTIVRVPGAFEMPLACKKLAASGRSHQGPCPCVSRKRRAGGLRPVDHGQHRAGHRTRGHQGRKQGR